MANITVSPTRMELTRLKGQREFEWQSDRNRYFAE